MRWKIYLASNYGSHPEMREVRTRLESLGHKVTSRWINGEHEAIEGQSHSINEKFALEDLEDIQNSNFIIWFSRYKSARGRGGRHVEFGYALALGIQIFVIGHKENVFHLLPQVKHFNTLEELISFLL
jgi:nucleoside 2-deoxyribosyltransferase